jgi:hypothetical protein
MYSLTNPSTDIFTIAVGLASQPTSDSVPRLYRVPRTLLDTLLYFKDIIDLRRMEGQDMTVYTKMKSPL